MRFTNFTVAALVAIFALSSGALASDTEADNKVKEVASRSWSAMLMTFGPRTAARVAKRTRASRAAVTSSASAPKATRSRAISVARRSTRVPKMGMTGVAGTAMVRAESQEMDKEASQETARVRVN